MAGLSVNPQAVAQARKDGYSDDEILGQVSQKNPDAFKAALADGYTSKEILNHLVERNTPDESFSGALKEGIAGVIGGQASTNKRILGVDTPGEEALAAKIAPKNYKPAQVINPDAPWMGNPLNKINFSQIPRAITEAAPGMATDLAVAGVTSAVPVVGPALALPAGVASYLYRTRGDAAKARAVTRTGDESAEPNTEDKLVTGATGVAEGALQRVGLGRLLPGGAATVKSVGMQGVKDVAAGLGKTAAVEGGVGAGQSAVGQVGQTIGTPGGVQVDPNEVASSAVTNAALGGAIGAPKAKAEAAAAIKFRDFKVEDNDANTSFANRVKAKAENLGNTSDAYKAVHEATTDVKNEIGIAVRGLSKNDRAALPIDAQNALLRAKRGEELNDSDIGAVSGALGANSPITDLVKQATVSAKLKKIGDYDYKSKTFKGGISNKIERGVRFFTNPVGYATGAGLAGLGVSGHAAAMFGYAPAALATILGGYGGARLVDRLSGARSPANQFANKFADGVKGRVSGPSSAQAVAQAQANAQAILKSRQAANASPVAPTSAALTPPPVSVSKKNGTVQVAPAPAAAASGASPFEFTPLDKLWGNGMSHADYAEVKAAKKLADNTLHPARANAYKDSVIDKRTETENSLYKIGNELDNQKDKEALQPIFEELHHTNSQARAHEVLRHLKSTLSPAKAALVDKYFPAGKVNRIWSN